MSADRLTVSEVLGLSTRYLRGHGSSTPRLDAEILTAHVLGLRRLDLYLDRDRPLTGVERDRLRSMVRRRAGGEPVAYIVGRRDFHGLCFEVDRNVLIPRPETETLVEAVIAHLRQGGRPSLVVDVGTGSGAIACVLAVECPWLRVVATDVSRPALEVAARNVSAHGLAERIALVCTDVLLGLGPGFDAVVSNPPYVALGERIDDSADRFEPAVALYSGDNGMDVTLRVVEQAAQLLAQGGLLALEVGSAAQRGRVLDLLQDSAWFENVREIPDPGGDTRAVTAVLARGPSDGTAR